MRPCSSASLTWGGAPASSSPAPATTRDAEDTCRHGVQGRVGDLRAHPRLASWPYPRHAEHPGARAADRADAGPALLQDQPDRDAAFRLFDEFLTGLPSGVQLFSLLRANPEPLLLADLMGAAPGWPII